jgi:hypothetical protein
MCVVAVYGRVAGFGASECSGQRARASSMLLAMRAGMASTFAVRVSMASVADAVLFGVVACGVYSPTCC